MGIGTIIRGWALAHQGQEAEGTAQILHGLDIYRTTGSGINWPQLLLPLAEAYELSGNAVEGLRAVEAALAAVEKTGERRDEAEVHRLKGVLALRSKASQYRIQSQSEAEEQFRKAIEVARRQSSKSWELRATTSLARLLAKQHGAGVRVPPPDLRLWHLGDAQICTASGVHLCRVRDRQHGSVQYEKR